MKHKTVVIDCLSDNLSKYIENGAVIVVDVIRSTTVEATVIASGRRCFFAPSAEKALLMAETLENPLLVGEAGGSMPYGFHLNNSPVDIEKRSDIERPAIIVSTSGTPLLSALNRNRSLYIACLRNYSATLNHVLKRYDNIAVVGAPTRGEFREEDQLCCAWIAVGLNQEGYRPKDNKTFDIINRWRNSRVEEITKGKSAKYLRETGQTRDLDFITSHIDDLDLVLAVQGNEIVKIN